MKRGRSILGHPGQIFIGFQFAPADQPGANRRVPAPLLLSDIDPSGDLRRRLELNFRRLHDPEFHFEAMISAWTAAEAPGDWVGRAMLSLSLAGQVLHTEPVHLGEIIARLPGAFNARGYIGAIHAPGTADENQVGGHNGQLRGLCELYLWKKDPRALAAIRSIITNLMVPTRALFAQYPSEKLDRLAHGQAVGLTVKNEGVWVGLSTDIGIVFFTLDGLTQAYLVDPRPDLRELIETMISRYTQIDPVKIGAQTHGTLSTLRGVLRWWETVDRRPEFLQLVRERYATYQTLAETEHHANYNWFGRPEWTEACAVVDSFLLAIELWRATADASYLSAAHRVYFNALSHAQRPNGGFGCDLCVGANGRVHLSPHPKIFEAPFCCSMRGTEGLVRAAQSNFQIDAEAGRVWSAFYFGGDYTLRFVDGVVTLRAASAYPYGGQVRWEVVASSCRTSKHWSLLTPPGVVAQDMRLSRADGSAVPAAINGSFVEAQVEFTTGAVFELTFPMRVYPSQPHSAEVTLGHHRFFHGPLLLGSRDSGVWSLRTDDEFEPVGGAGYRCRRAGVQLLPIEDLTFRTVADAKASVAQVLFAED